MEFYDKGHFLDASQIQMPFHPEAKNMFNSDTMKYMKFIYFIVSDLLLSRVYYEST